MSEPDASSWLRRWVLPCALVALSILAFRSVVLDWNPVPSDSMRPAILPGDRIAVDKLAYGLRLPFSTIFVVRWKTPGRGDIVVFLAPDAGPEPGRRLVKRVVGLPGDEVAVRRGRLHLDGAAVTHDESPGDERSASPGPSGGDPRVAVERPAGELSYRVLVSDWNAAGDWGPVTVPSGHVFVLGDHRDASADSRAFGLLPLRRILGRATHVVVSTEPGGLPEPRWRRFFQRLR